MYKHLLRRPAGACLEIGARITPKLWADPALASSAAALQAGQDRLMARWTAHEAAVEAARSAVARRDEARRMMEGRLREFAANVLASVRNNHEADAYLRYFPVGFGNAVREKPEGFLEATRVILRLLEEETDPWLAGFHGRIASALEEYEAAQAPGDAALAARDDAFAYLAAERRSWVQALSVSRLEAMIACLDDAAHVSEIFSPAAVRRRGADPAAASAIRECEAVAAATTVLAAAAATPTTALVPPPPLQLIVSPHQSAESRASTTRDRISGWRSWLAAAGLHRMVG